LSLYLRLVIGPVVVCDLELFGMTSKPDLDPEPPAQLAGGAGTVVSPESDEPEVFGFTRRPDRDGS
jgi:hypothetical protein